MGREMKFDPGIYKGKDIVSIKTSFTGIRTLHAWSEDLKKYIPKKTGSRYSAAIKIYGHQKEKYFERLEDAKRWRVTGGKEDTVQKSLFFGDLLDRYFAHISSRVNPSTLQTYLNNSRHLKHFKMLQVDGITPQVIDDWLIAIKKKDYLKAQHETRVSYRKEVSVLRQVFKHYCEYIDKNGFHSPVKERHLQDAIIDQRKFKESKARNQTKFMSSEESQNFLVALRTLGMKANANFGFYALAFFQLQTGARIGEACALGWHDINFHVEKAMISKSVQWGRRKGTETFIQSYTKTGEPREVPLTAALINVLTEWKSLSRGQGLIFSNDGVTPYSFRAIQYAYNLAFETTGVKWRSTHILRHTFSTDFLRATKDFMSLAKILGHANTRQTEHYAKVTGSMAFESFEIYKERSAERMDNVINFKKAAG